MCELLWDLALHKYLQAIEESWVGEIIFAREEHTN